MFGKASPVCFCHGSHSSSAKMVNLWMANLWLALQFHLLAFPFSLGSHFPLRILGDRRDAGGNLAWARLLCGRLISSNPEYKSFQL